MLHLSLAGLVALALLAAAVTTVQRRLERPVPGDLLAAADQPAGEVAVEHRVTVVSGARLAADPPGEAFRSLGGFGCP